MTRSNNKNVGLDRVTWSVDPFTEVSRLEVMAQLLAGWEKEIGTKVEPTYVLSPERLNWTGNFSPPWFQQFRPLVKEKWEKLKDSFPPNDFLDLLVLTQSQPSLEKAAKRLVQTARRNKSQAIAIGSHGKSQLQRLFLGSFTEILIQTSSLPLVIVSPEATSTDGLRHLLFCTDLSPAGKRLFQKVQNMAKALSARLTLVHKLPNIVDPLLQTGVYMMGGGWVALPNYLSDQEKALKERAQKWCEEAKRKNVDIDLKLISREEEISEALLQIAEQTPNSMMVLAAESGSLGSWLVGSISRDVIRRSPVPTLVYPLKYKS